MKKILTALILLALLATSCTSNNDESNDGTLDSNTPEINESNDSSESNESDDTIGDENNDGIIEDGNDENTSEGDVPAATPVTKVESGDDAVAFIDANVYPNCSDFIPMYTESRVLDFADTDTITFMTGLTDLTGISDVIISESMVGSFPYSLIMLRTDGSDVEGAQKRLGESVDPNKWICVSAEKVASIALDNDIILIMGAVDQVEAIMDAITVAADGVYSSVGSVVNVLG